MTTPRRIPSSGNRVTFSDKSPSIESWTVEQTAHVLASTSLSPDIVRGTSSPLAIPLDVPSRAPTPRRTPPPPSSSAPVPAHLNWTPAAARASRSDDDDDDPSPRGAHTVHGRRAPIRRDSLKRREALLRGKEGSRRRQRWENDRLLHVPGAQPPLPSDWAQPVWPVPGDAVLRPVPYFLAPLWDAKYAASASASAGRRHPRSGQEGDVDEAERDKERVARELREKLKKARGAKGLLQDLELEVRNFLLQCEVRRHHDGEQEGLVGDESDDEIVFVGRNGSMSDRHDGDGDKQARLVERAERLIFQSLERDQGACFGRWLVHSIADYYGLETWSVTTGDPAQRSAYVGLRPSALDRGQGMSGLPQPLWVMV